MYIKETYPNQILVLLLQCAAASSRKREKARVSFFLMFPSEPKRARRLPEDGRENFKIDLRLHPTLLLPPRRGMLRLENEPPINTTPRLKCDPIIAGKESSSSSYILSFDHHLARQQKTMLLPKSPAEDYSIPPQVNALRSARWQSPAELFECQVQSRLHFPLT